MDKTRIAIALVLGLLLGFSFGFYVGTYKALDWSVDKAVYLIELKGIEVDVNKELITWGLMTYKRRIDDAFIRNNTGN